jgi:ATP-dependent DNA helicase PIF1
MTQEQALQILKTGENVFLTGEPGAGKTYVLNKYIGYLKEHAMPVSVTASTGIAATHIKGITLHAFAGLGPQSVVTQEYINTLFTRPYVIKRIAKTNVLIIDEISMISAQVLTSVDSICKAVKKSHLPFGGMQVVFVGDFFQLPPIAKRDEPVDYAYKSLAWQEASPNICYISEQFRQEDGKLLKLLRAIRTESVDEVHIELLQEKLTKSKGDTLTTQLYTHNINVDEINQQELEKLDGISKFFTMEVSGNPHLIETLKKGCLSPDMLELKIGAVVMCTKNNPAGGYVNGTIGTVIGYDVTFGSPIIITKNGERLTIEQTDWAIEEEGKVKASIVQVPLRLAWAITIHKSQGMSLDSAVIDLSRTFEYGQGYVALSRVKSLDTIQLLGINQKALQVNPNITEKDKEFLKESALIEMNVNIEDLSKKAQVFIAKYSKMSIGGVEKDRYEYTKELVLKKLSLATIAKQRELAIGTIIEHVRLLIDSKRLTINDITYLKTPAVESILPKLKVVVEQEGRDKLKPLFDFLGGSASYDDIKLALVFTEV